MARPTKTEEERKRIKLAVRLTGMERVRLERDAERAGINLSEYARRLLTESRVIVQKKQHLAPVHVVELSRVGNNLNQIARALNSKDIVERRIIDAAASDLRNLIQGIAFGADVVLSPTRPDGVDGPNGGPSLN